MDKTLSLNPAVSKARENLAMALSHCHLMNQCGLNQRTLLVVFLEVSSLPVCPLVVTNCSMDSNHNGRSHHLNIFDPNKKRYQTKLKCDNTHTSIWSERMKSCGGNEDAKITSKSPFLLVSLRNAG